MRNLASISLIYLYFYLFGQSPTHNSFLFFTSIVLLLRCPLLPAWAPNHARLFFHRDIPFMLLMLWYPVPSVDRFSPFFYGFDSPHQAIHPSGYPSQSTHPQISHARLPFDVDALLSAVRLWNPEQDISPLQILSPPFGHPALGY